MALDFLAIRTEVLERGFDFLSSGTDLVRVKRWVNAAMHQVDRKENWAYLFVSSAQLLPNPLANLRSMESVTIPAEGRALVRSSRVTLAEAYGDLTTTGDPEYWYFSYLAGTGRVVATFPVGPVSTSYLLTYFRSSADLVNDTDVPLMPDEYREIIVELVCRAAFRDSNQYEAAADCLTAADLILGEMRESLLDMPAFVARTEAAVDD